MLFGGSATDDLSHELQSAMASPAVGSIVLDVDSPGGGVSRIKELADQIYQASRQKRIVGVANAQAGSAAYWLLSQCSEAVVRPSDDVGSVGVLSVHADQSRALDQAGIKVSVIKSAKHKAEGSPFESLSNDAREAYPIAC
jgi:ClpP class serine protease